MNIVIPPSKFPKIENINDVLKYVSDNKAIINYKNTNGTQVLVYTIISPEVFNNEYALECRGITFDDKGKIIGRPLHKFFNIGENEKTSINNIDFSKVKNVYDKIDGSMVTAHRVNGKVEFKTKMSFESDVIKKVNKYLEVKKNIVKFCNEIVDEFTPIFEFTAPDNKIVIPYTETQLTLLHVRHIITGAYIDLKDPCLEELIKKYNILTCETISSFKNKKGELKIKEMISCLHNDLKFKEGFVICFDNGDMVKAKSSWYNDLHKISTFLRERDVVKSILSGNIDDVKAALSITSIDNKEINRIIELEIEVANRIINIKEEILKAYHFSKGKTDKEKYNENKNSIYISYIMKVKKYNDINNIDFNNLFRKMHIKEYSLNTLV